SQRWGFYELLDSGAVMLMVRHRVAFQEGRPPQALQSKATPARYTRMPDMYLYQKAGALPTRVTNLKRLLADLPGDRQALAEFADAEDISVRKKDDLVRLIRYCNQAVHSPTCRPPLDTPWMRLQFVMASKGSASSARKSAHFPGSSVQTPSRPRHRAASPVAERSTC